MTKEDDKIPLDAEYMKGLQESAVFKNDQVFQTALRTHFRAAKAGEIPLAISCELEQLMDESIARSKAAGNYPAVPQRIRNLINEAAAAVHQKSRIRQEMEKMERAIPPQAILSALMERGDLSLNARASQTYALEELGKPEYQDMNLQEIREAMLRIKILTDKPEASPSTPKR